MTCCGLDATARRARLILRTAPALILAAGLLATSASGAVTRGGKPDAAPGKPAAAPVEAPAAEPGPAPPVKKAKNARSSAKQRPAKGGKKPR